MWTLGYRAFKYVNQRAHPRLRLTEPPREGTFVDTRFTIEVSGPFGRSHPDPGWRSTRLWPGRSGSGSTTTSAGSAASIATYSPRGLQQGPSDYAPPDRLVRPPCPARFGGSPNRTRLNSPASARRAERPERRDASSELRRPSTCSVISTWRATQSSAVRRGTATVCRPARRLRVLRCRRRSMDRRPEGPGIARRRIPRGVGEVLLDATDSGDHEWSADIERLEPDGDPGCVTVGLQRDDHGVRPLVRGENAGTVGALCDRYVRQLGDVADELRTGEDAHLDRRIGPRHVEKRGPIPVAVVAGATTRTPDLSPVITGGTRGRRSVPYGTWVTVAAGRACLARASLTGLSVVWTAAPSSSWRYSQRRGVDRACPPVPEPDRLGDDVGPRVSRNVRTTVSTARCSRSVCVHTTSAHRSPARLPSA